MADRLKGKVAIVTGGGQGIGGGIARMFAAEGAHVAVAARTESRLQEVVKQISGAGGEAIYIVTDVGQADQVQKLVEETCRRFGGLDILVNNAGVGLRRPVEKVDISDYDRLMDTNLKGMYMGCHYAVPHLKNRGGGAIINMSSVHGVDGGSLNTVYAATKGGIIGCTRALAAELAPHYVRVNTISPGAIKVGEESRLLRSQIAPEHWPEFERRFLPKLQEARKYFQPLELVAEPVDIAYCAVYLASEEARFVTGQNFVVDGGLTTHLSAYASESARRNMPLDFGEMTAWIEEHRAQ